MLVEFRSDASLDSIYMLSLGVTFSLDLYMMNLGMTLPGSDVYAEFWV
jgi:hypothetical protein